MGSQDPPRLDAAARAVIEDALRRGVNVEVRLGPDRKVQVFELTKKIKYSAP